MLHPMRADATTHMIVFCFVCACLLANRGWRSIVEPGHLSIQRNVDDKLYVTNLVFLDIKHVWETNDITPRY